MRNQLLTYCTGISKSPTAASFVRPTRPADSPRSFLQALNDKYVAQLEQRNGRGSVAEIVISGKRAEEVGFDKIRRQQSKVDELTIVILEDMQISSALAQGEDDSTIRKTCPKITQLDLSRNLLEDFGPVVSICRQLPAVRSLGIKYVFSVDMKKPFAKQDTVVIAFKTSWAINSSRAPKQLSKASRNCRWMKHL